MNRNGTNLPEFEKSVIEKTKNYVKAELEDEGTGHDWWHTYRVWKMAKRISQVENVNIFLVELAALMHDIADWKLHNGDTSISDQKISNWLSNCGIDQYYIDNVRLIVNSISFKGAGVSEEEDLSLEAKVVQDADRLDAMGALGIARVFTYGGKFDRKIYDPNIGPVYHRNANEYLDQEGTSINHFYEKLLLIKGRMNTKTAQEIALGRHRFLEDYLQEFFLEWEGER